MWLCFVGFFVPETCVGKLKIPWLKCSLLSPRGLTWSGLGLDCRQRLVGEGRTAVPCLPVQVEGQLSAESSLMAANFLGNSYESFWVDVDNFATPTKSSNTL